MTPEPVLELFGHPFSSYTWKALIALYAHDVPFVLQVVDAEHPEHAEVVQMAGPLGKFPVLRDGENLLFEATTIIEYIDRHHVAPGTLLPEDPDAATAIRMLDRVFDNYVMNVMQIVVNEYIRDPENPDLTRCAEARAQLNRVYAWLEGWLQFYPPMEHVTLIECAAAPALFYADWVHPIPEDRPRLRAWRAHLLSLPAVARCVDEARPFRAYFPLGAPDRD
ncbi:MAG: glutathione S-transferase family protein [Novosphingobium sp.]|uniref:glutathione S-transferase family protein n=1 Tax=Novosphingobium sp. TaxID=1874826 RepID=UPI0012C378EF|nr:glutathione S-transferase family protein [Novosphingobium sp.]MPS70644.1 glutathione S-transferase family protein [Novosphingobium sp.]